MLADKLFALHSFQRQYKSLLILSVNQTIHDIEWAVPKERLLEDIDWNNVLSISSVLSFSTEVSHLEAALRISQTCLSIEYTNYTQRHAAVVILENLANKQAINLAITRRYIPQSYKDALPTSLKFDIIKNNLENSIIVNNRLLHVNRFQKDVYEAHRENQLISVSAPTSAGKSFILGQIIVDELSSGNINVVYIVPTRALISQVESDLRSVLIENNLRTVNVSSVPHSIVQENQNNVYVFTQERLHWFLINNDNVSIDVLIIDEAQKIDDSNRGILLQQKIEEVSLKNPEVKVYFSSPFTANPELLLNDFNSNKAKDVVNTQVVSVNQNLIYLTQVPRNILKYKAVLCFKETSLELGYITLKDRSGPNEFVKLCRIANAISGSSGGGLIYSNGAAESEKIGDLLYNQLPEISTSTKLKELIKLVKRTIHARYSLARVLKKGIAFHYGNIPLLIRQEIENLFRDGEIKYLICTSTLLEGVNLPAKSIFIRNPTRGKGRPMSENDFWNLAGRAGRLGKEMSGNIVCFEPHSWDVRPNPNRQKQVIRRALDEIINMRSREFIQYLMDGTPRSKADSNQDFEFAFGYFYNRFLKGDLENNGPFFNQLIPILSNLRRTIRVPDYIIRRNPGISPIAQQELLEYFEGKKEIESLLPVYPEDVDAQKHYIELLGRIGKTISRYPHQLYVARAILLISWMKGAPLSQLISSTYKYYQSKEKYKKKKSLPVVIREVMDAVENFVRFRFAKDSNCYIDILRYFLEINNKQDLLEKIPELTLWLEFGVNQKSHLSLLSLGLSRNSVIEISIYLPSTTMDREECIRWLSSNPLAELEISPIIIGDIERAMDGLGS